MKKTITMFRLLLVAGLLFGLSVQTNAQTTSAMGSDLTYVNIAPNTYLVQFKLYRDCTGTDPGPAQTLNYRAAGCDTTFRNITLNRVGTPVSGDPYCNNPAPCTGNSSGLVNYQEHTYQTTVTLPSLCANWVLSVRIANRPNSRNLSYGEHFAFYTETLINNVATQVNNSPTFSNLPIVFASVDQHNVYNQNVTDVDGDSVVYSLVPALTNFNTPVVYGHFFGAGTGTNPYPAGTSPAGTSYPTGNFSSINPIISRNPLALDLVTGMMVFEPLSFKGPSQLTFLGQDKYTVAVRVDEYRKINGVPTKIGHLRREIMIVVVENVTIFPIQFNSGGQPVKAVYEIPAMYNTCLSFNAVTLNAGSSVVMTSNASQISPSATFTVAGSTTSKTGTFCWRPTIADIRSTPYRLMITVRENNCPFPSFTVHSINIKVVKHKISDPGPVVITDPNQPGVSRQAIPNIITPNGDGLNDAFIIPDLPENAELQIFDRKQKLVKTFKRYQNNWNAEGMKEGVYYFILKNKVTGEVIKGEVTVVR